MNPSVESNQEGFNKAAKQGDGRLSVTLLGLVMAAAAATVFQLTITYLEPHDTLSRSVPADAAVYMHINTGLLGDDGISALLPDNIRADEVAKFAVVDEDRDLAWGTLFGWQRDRRPTDQELNLLDGEQALKLDDHTFLTGDESLLRLYGTEPKSWTSLAEDIGVVRSLGVVRGLAPVQGYLNPVIAPPNIFAGAAAPLKEVEPLVFALDRQKDGYYAVAMLTRAAAGFPSWLGFAPAQRTSADVKIADAPADLSLISDRAVFDPIAVFFGKIEKASAALGLEHREQLDTASDNLRALLASSPVYLSIISDGSDNEASAGAEYSAVAPEDIMTAVSAYISNSLPERLSLVLPDGDAVTELRLEPDKYMPTKADPALNGARVLEVKSVGFKLIYRDNGRGGVVIANDGGLLDRFSEQQAHMIRGRCATLGGQKLAVNAPIITVLSSVFGASRFPALADINNIKFGLFIENSDDTLVSCGYR
jgi:hypothetical protein